VSHDGYTNQKPYKTDYAVTDKQHVTDNMSRAGKLLYKLRRIYGCTGVDEIVDEAIRQRAAPPQSPPAVTEDGMGRAAVTFRPCGSYSAWSQHDVLAFARAQVDAERKRVREEDCRAVCWPLAPERPHPHDKGVHSQACDAIRKLGGSL